MKYRSTLALAAVFAVGALAGPALAQGSDPRAQALKLYKVFQKQDWKGLYYIAAFAPSVQKQLPGADKFASQVKEGIQKSGNAAQVDLVFKNMSGIRTGPAKVAGGKADVPTSSKITVNGKTIAFQGVAHMVKQGGTWKWDLTSNTDPGQATQIGLSSLLGKPVGQPAGRR